jgi:TolA-binding protein
LKLLTLLTLSLLFTSCFKTAEEIRRDKKVDEMIGQSASLTAELQMKMNELQNKLASTSGQIEEIDYKATTNNQETTKTLSQTIASLSEQVKILNKENSDNKAEIQKIQSELDAQKKYVSKLTGTLNKIAGPSKSSSGSKIQDAHKAFEKNDQKEATKLYEQVLAEGKINNRQKNHVRYNLGLMSYWNKKYDDALSYFSSIYTKWPKSSWAPRALLQIARTFKKQNKKAEANATYDEIIQKFASSSEAKKAKEEKGK